MKDIIQERGSSAFGDAMPDELCDPAEEMDPSSDFDPIGSMGECSSVKHHEEHLRDVEEL